MCNGLHCWNTGWGGARFARSISQSAGDVHWTSRSSPTCLKNENSQTERSDNFHGWGGGTRTPECQDQNLVPYHLATPHCYIYDVVWSGTMIDGFGPGHVWIYSRCALKQPAALPLGHSPTSCRAFIPATGEIIANCLQLLNDWVACGTRQIRVLHLWVLSQQQPSPLRYQTHSVHPYTQYQPTLRVGIAPTTTYVSSRTLTT